MATPSSTLLLPVRGSEAWRRFPVVAGVLAVLAVLALLGIAEAVWLPRGMPREYVARGSFVVIPSGDALAARPEVWRAAMLGEAVSDELLAEIAATLNLRQAGRGQPITEGELRGHLAVTAQCVQAAGAAAGGAPAARVSVTVRGLPQSQVEVVVQAWSAGVRRRIAALAVEAPAQYVTPYSPCLEP